MADDTMTRFRAAQAAVREEYLAGDGRPWVVGYSGGKDSTLVAQLVFETLLDLAPSDRVRPVHLLCNDTLVESPVLAAYVRAMLVRLAAAAENLSLPIEVVTTTPDPDQTFWVNLIGRGYPAPTRLFRWCTDRMKIAPTSGYIKARVSEAGAVVLLLGVRAAESSARAATVARHKNTAGSRYNPHADLPGCVVFRPIVDLTTDDVWQLLLQRRPPWGGSHRDLVTLYKNAQGGECPLVVDRSSAAGCGTGSSRFGCWTCTVVEKDRSMEAMVDAGEDRLAPLLDFRDWLAKARDDRTKRSLRSRSGRIPLWGDGGLNAGPFTLEARAEILERLLAAQAESGHQLITQGEIDRCRSLWTDDAVTEARRHLDAGLARKE